ncbi:MAG: hypothetical protein AAB513_01570 [Patescibacteria group bacterium]
MATEDGFQNNKYRTPVHVSSLKPEEVVRRQIPEDNGVTFSFRYYHGGSVQLFPGGQGMAAYMPSNLSSERGPAIGSPFDDVTTRRQFLMPKFRAIESETHLAFAGNFRELARWNFPDPCISINSFGGSNHYVPSKNKQREENPGAGIRFNCLPERFTKYFYGAKVFVEVNSLINTTGGPTFMGCLAGKYQLWGSSGFYFSPGSGLCLGTYYNKDRGQTLPFGAITPGFSIDDEHGSEMNFALLLKYGFFGRPVASMTYMTAGPEQISTITPPGMNQGLFGGINAGGLVSIRRSFHADFEVAKPQRRR